MANPSSRLRVWRGRIALLAAGGVAFACSSNDSSSGGGSGAGGSGAGTGGTQSAAGAGAKGSSGGTGGTTGGAGGSSGTGGAAMAGTGASGTGGNSTAGRSGTGGTGATGGSAGTGVAGVPGGGAPNAGTGGTSSGATGGSAGTGTAAGNAGSGGAPAGGMGGSGGASTANFTCNQVIGIDSTSEWYTSGFETYVPDGKWQLLYHHPGYIEDWGNASDDVWKTSVTMVTSPCTTNSTNPDRVIFNMFADGSDSSITNKAAFAAGLDKVIAQIKAHYSNVKRIDLLTMTRAPMNMACSSSNAAGSMIPQYEDDAVAMEVASGPPSVVASPPFFAPDCTVFDSTGGPHFSDSGKPIIAQLYGDYYAAGN